MAQLLTHSNGDGVKTHLFVTPAPKHDGKWLNRPRYIQINQGGGATFLKVGRVHPASKASRKCSSYPLIFGICGVQPETSE